MDQRPIQKWPKGKILSWESGRAYLVYLENDKYNLIIDYCGSRVLYSASNEDRMLEFAFLDLKDRMKSCF